jgi:hypothetical protein
VKEIHLIAAPNGADSCHAGGLTNFDTSIAAADKVPPWSCATGGRRAEKNGVKANLMMAVLGAGLAAAGCAGGPRGEPERREAPRVLLSADTLVFASFDADGDLRVDVSERDAGIAREWTRADANGDGTIAPIEFQAWVGATLGGANMPPYRLDFDRNVDNAISRAEFETEFRGRFDDYDADKDAVLTRAEFVRELRRPQMRSGPGEGGPPRRRPPG